MNPLTRFLRSRGWSGEAQHFAKDVRQYTAVRDVRGKDDYCHQRGYGKIVAISSSVPSSSSSNATRLTELSHSSPLRLVPSRRSHPINVGHQAELTANKLRHEAAIVHLSSYGGGLVPGDILNLDVEVRGHGATLCVLTQGGTRVYRPGEHFRQCDKFILKKEKKESIKQSHDFEVISASQHHRSDIGEITSKQTSNPSSILCKSSLKCTVEPGATFLYLPDPTVPYYQSSFQEHREFNCLYEAPSKLYMKSHETSTSSRKFNEQNTTDFHSTLGGTMGSIICVDWYSSGRRFSTGLEEERWAFNFLSTRTALYLTEQSLCSPAKSRPERIEPVLIDSMTFNNSFSLGSSGTSTSTALSMGQNHDSFATLLLHGPSSLSVAKRATELSRRLAKLQTRVRSNDFIDSNSGNIQNDVTDQNILADSEDLQLLLDSLGGKVLMSVTPIDLPINITSNDDQMSKQPNQYVETPQAFLHLARVLAESNEDIYRVLHYCLKPCAELLGGLEPYKDRIHSSKTVRNKTTTHIQAIRDELKKSSIKAIGKQNLRQIADQLVFCRDHSDNVDAPDFWFRSCMLSDSSLPVGSFAHSFGIEAATQMGVFDQKIPNRKTQSLRDTASSYSKDALSGYIHAVSRSNARFSTPLVLAGYSLVVDSLSSLDVQQVYQSWLKIDAHLDSLLVTNEPGRRASMDQGLGLLRIASSFMTRDSVLKGSVNKKFRNDEISGLWEKIKATIDNHSSKTSANYLMKSDTSSPSAKGHAAPIYGILAATLGISPLEACRIFAFGAARDSVSAAVRLNLLGPIAGLSVLDEVGREAVEMGLEDGLMQVFHLSPVDSSSEGKIKSWIEHAATCAPIMDVVQPCHDMLSVRLFRT